MEVFLVMVGIVVAVSVLASAFTGLLALIMLVIMIWPFLVCFFVAANALLSGSYVAAAVWTLAGLVLQFLWLSIRERTKLPRQAEPRDQGIPLCQMPVGREEAIDWYIRRMSNSDTVRRFEHDETLHSENIERQT
ncbi:MAG: hypothetical protein AAF700_02100 [Pseudomonadota bacterium]